MPEGDSTWAGDTPSPDDGIPHYSTGGLEEGYLDLRDRHRVAPLFYNQTPSWQIFLWFNLASSLQRQGRSPGKYSRYMFCKQRDSFGVSSFGILCLASHDVQILLNSTKDELDASGEVWVSQRKWAT